MEHLGSQNVDAASSVLPPETQIHQTSNRFQNPDDVEKMLPVVKSLEPTTTTSRSLKRTHSPASSSSSAGKEGVARSNYPAAAASATADNCDSDDENGETPSVSFKFRQETSKIGRLRAMKKGDLTANNDSIVVEAHKQALFTVDIASWVMPPLDKAEVDLGGSERRKRDEVRIEGEIKRIRRLKRELNTKTLQHLDLYESNYAELIREDEKKILDKGRKHRELLAKNFQYVVATSGSSYIFVYVTTESSACKLLLRQVYKDKNGDEFYCVKFTTLSSNRVAGSSRFSGEESRGDHEHRVLVATGLKGVIRIIDVEKGKCIDTISPAAGNSINDISIHPKYSELLACASKDLSVHVWNLNTSIKVFRLCSRGLFGHVDELLTCDWSPDEGRKLVSSGMDHYLIVWDMSNPECKDAIELSYKYGENCDEEGKLLYKPKFPVKIFFPMIVDKTIHKNYVDCAKFLTPEIVISKSSDNHLVAWLAAPSLFRQEDETVQTVCNVLFQYSLVHCKVWFMKFALQPCYNRLLALGLEDGRVLVLDLKSDPDASNLRVMHLRESSHHHGLRAIRQVAFSPDSKVIVAVTQDAKVVKWSLSGRAIGDRPIFPLLDSYLNRPSNESVAAEEAQEKNKDEGLDQTGNKENEEPAMSAAIEQVDKNFDEGLVMMQNLEVI